MLAGVPAACRQGTSHTLQLRSNRFLALHQCRHRELSLSQHQLAWQLRQHQRWCWARRRLRGSPVRHSRWSPPRFTRTSSTTRTQPAGQRHTAVLQPLPATAPLRTRRRTATALQWQAQLECPPPFRTQGTAQHQAALHQQTRAMVLQGCSLSCAQPRLLRERVTRPPRACRPSLPLRWTPCQRQQRAGTPLGRRTGVAHWRGLTLLTPPAMLSGYQRRRLPSALDPARHRHWSRLIHLRLPTTALRQ